MRHERRIVGVVGSLLDEHREQARLLGALLAERGLDLLTDGRGGAARTVAEAFVTARRREGLSLAICPGALDVQGYRCHPGVPNAYVELAIRTHLPATGGAGQPLEACAPLLVLTAGALVVLPGEEETRAVAEAAARLERPALLYGPPDAFRDFPPGLERAPGLMRVCDFLFEVFPPGRR